MDPAYLFAQDAVRNGPVDSGAGFCGVVGGRGELKDPCRSARPRTPHGAHRYSALRLGAVERRVVPMSSGYEKEVCRTGAVQRLIVEKTTEDLIGEPPAQETERIILVSLLELRCSTPLEPPGLTEKLRGPLESAWEDPGQLLSSRNCG